MEDLGEIEKELRQLLEETNFSEERISQILAAQCFSDGAETMKLEIDDSTLNSLEYIRVEEEGEAKEREQQFLSGTGDDESDEDFSWMDEVGQDKVDGDAYFTFINETRRVMKKGTQAWNCYGNRSNFFLLVNYGFCYPNNLYDSLLIHVRLDLTFSAESPITLKKMVWPTAKRENT